MFDKKQNSTTENSQNTENAGSSSNYPNEAAKSSSASKGCGCGCKHAAPVEEEVIEIEEEQRWDY